MIIRPNLQYHIVNHCQLKCAGCGTHSETANAFFNDIVQYEKDIIKLSEFMHFRSLTILGGEPLLHKDLIEFLKIAKKVTISDIVSLTTNGQFLYKQPDDFWRNLDRIIISLYPNSGINNDDVLSHAKQKCDEFGVKLDWSFNEEFNVIHTDFSKRDTQKIFDTCKITHDWSCHYFNNGRYYKCINPILENHVDNGVELEKTAIMNYINDSTPLKSCYGCLGTSGPKFKHHQIK